VSERGKYIVGEGGDGAGKSTQILLMDNYIRSLGGDTLRVFNEETGRMEPVQEPGGTKRANELRRMIKDKSLSRTPWQAFEWLTEARLSLNEECIQPSLDKGLFVLSGRNWYSSIVYQGMAGGIPLDEIEQYTREKLGEVYMTPDLTGVFAIQDEKKRQERLKDRVGIDSEKDYFDSMPPEFHSAGNLGYIALAKARHLPLIDAAQSEDTVHQNFLVHVRPLLSTLVA